MLSRPFYCPPRAGVFIGAQCQNQQPARRRGTPWLVSTVTLTGSFPGLQYDLLLAVIFAGCVALSFTRQTPLLRMAITLICAIPSGFASVQPGATVVLPEPPKPVAPPAAMQPVPPGRVVPSEPDSAVCALIGRAEEAAATTHAARQFIRDNGMAPP